MPAVEARPGHSWRRRLVTLALIGLAGAGCQTLSEGKPAKEIPPDLAVHYVCNDRTRFVARFVFAEPRYVLIERAGKQPFRLAQRPAAAGFRYGDGRHLLTGEGAKAEWRVGATAPATCFVQRPPAPYVPGSALSRPAG